MPLGAVARNGLKLASRCRQLEESAYFQDSGVRRIYRVWPADAAGMGWLDELPSRATIPPMRERSAAPHDDPPGERLVFRRGRLRKREDDEVRMMREALANLEDAPRVKRVLLELSRFYNPVADGPVIDPSTRHAVIACLDAADLAGARALLEAHLATYLRLDEPPRSTEPSPGTP